MKREDFLKEVKKIGSMEDAETIRAEFAELSNNLTETFDENERLAERAAQLEADNEKLRAANMKLFTSLGVKDEPDDEDEQEEQEPEKRKFEDLFNEKGELK